MDLGWFLGGSGRPLGGHWGSKIEFFRAFIAISVKIRILKHLGGVLGRFWEHFGAAWGRFWQGLGRVWQRLWHFPPPKCGNDHCQNSWRHLEQKLVILWVWEGF